MSIEGMDMQGLGQTMLAQTSEQPDDANLWMNLSILMQCLGQRDMGLVLQEQALALQRTYHLPATVQPARCRLLMLMLAGDLAANTPLECLLENSDIDLSLYYVTPGDPLALPLPEHDVLMVAMSEADDNHDLLRTLEQRLCDWPKPVINAAKHLPAVGRDVASALLQTVPGVLMPPTLRSTRAALHAIATGAARLPELFDGCDFPIILRPVGSQAGRDLEKITGPDEVASYLSRVDAEDIYVSRFIDYSGADGYFRKIRVALIDGAPFVCHMAVSSTWMVHYVNAGMYEEAWKREEELAFMEDFPHFVAHHQAALAAIYQRTQLDYVCIDCAQTPDGKLLVFEIDHAMVVHAMDLEDQFPYKQVHMLKVKNAFRDYLFRLSVAQPLKDR
jgi:glutathione synthase/RimK-type ligase-like ATP-grasp enzyme